MKIVCVCVEELVPRTTLEEFSCKQLIVTSDVIHTTNRGQHLFLELRI
jgi:hypothetical protein